MGMSYEDKMKLLAHAKPEKKDLLLARIIKGETVDITQDEDLFYQVNKDRVSLSDFTERDKFKIHAEAMKQDKAHLFDKNHGKSANKKFRWLGDIPPEIYFSRPEFSPMLSRAERDKNIKKWLNQYPVFRAGEKAV